MFIMVWTGSATFLIDPFVFESVTRILSSWAMEMPFQVKFEQTKFSFQEFLLVVLLIHRKKVIRQKVSLLIFYFYFIFFAGFSNN